MASDALIPSDRIDDQILLSEFSGRICYGEIGLPVTFVVTGSHILVFESSILKAEANNVNKAMILINLDDVIGVRMEERTLYVYEYTHELKGCMSGENRIRRVSTFSFPNGELLAQYSSAISSIISQPLVSRSQLSSLKKKYENHGKIEPNPIHVGPDKGVVSGAETATSRKFLIFVNPHSGTKHAMNIYEGTKAMYEEARIETTLVVTEYALHAMEYVQDTSRDLSQYSCICVIAGDGLLYEIINGIASRPDGSGLSLLKRLPIAPIPGGSANGLAKSICFASNNEPYSAVNCTFIAIKGKSQALDLSLVNTKSETHYSFLSLGWGLISDIDILSESMRFMGETRLYAAAVYFIAAKRRYKGCLRMILTTESKQHSSLEDTAESDSEIFRDAATKPYRMVIKGDFLLIWVVQTSHTASTMHSGPGVELDDAVFTIYVVRDMSRCGLLKLLIDIDSGNHVKSSNVEIYKAHSYSIDPITCDGARKGIYSLDGEVVEYGPIRGTVLPHAARIMKI